MSETNASTIATTANTTDEAAILDARLEDLRSQLAAVESASYTEGRRAGRTWAMTRASLWQLYRVENYRRQQSAGGEWNEWFPRVSAFNPIPPEHRFANMVGSPSRVSNLSRDDSTEFFTRILGNPAAEGRDGEYYTGFCVGAATAFEHIKNRL